MPFLHNITPEWLEEEYRRWRESPSAVDPAWHTFFTGFDLGCAWQPEAPHPDLPEALRQSGVQSLLYRYRDIGHLLACTDPLTPCPTTHPLLELSQFGLSEADLAGVFHTRRYFKDTATLGEILETMRETYCRHIGVEFMYIQEPAERQWLMDRMEPCRNREELSIDERLHFLGLLQRATLFEEFLHRRFPGQKRFSLEGGEGLIVCLDRAVSRAASQGVREIELGMAHRGRLNVLANILGKPLPNIFAEFEDNLQLGFVGEGDVKYHKGYSVDRELPSGERLHLSLAFNPSHLEAVDPVVVGKSRARQDRLGEKGRQEVLPILIHGDAAFAGQGMVTETLNLSQLEGYGTGGTLHIVVNNQIGFTTLPEDSRSTRYATDVARMLMVPIFHVNGEEPEAIARVASLALDYRREFGRDVVVEIICYRRHGHNEGDEPAFTQPRLYAAIRGRQPAHVIYARRLADEGVSGELVSSMAAAYRDELEKGVGGEPLSVDAGFGGDWQGVVREYLQTPVETAVAEERLRQLGAELAAIPPGFSPHPKLVSLYGKRSEALQVGEGVDWGNAESLAFATLLGEGVTVRLSGQDSRRGTFNHRHAVLHDLESDATHTPLASLAGGELFHVYDSMLSENAVLGFEYGYSLAAPGGLVIWEAQFGDFANGAQVIIDQFIASGESKWDRACGLVLLLPHGYEGNGAEHSSARIERFLSLCAENNLQVAAPSTPAQLFHLLRRQVRQPFRKPLVLFTPKSLLRHPACVSSLAELSQGGFREILADTASPQGRARLVLCSGKIWHELAAERERRGSEDVAIVRIEQLYPLRGELLLEALAPYGPPAEVRWVQEEPANMGPWPFLRPRLTALLGVEPAYVGRPESAAPASGSHRIHGEEQARLIAGAFD